MHESQLGGPGSESSSMSTSLETQMQTTKAGAQVAVFLTNAPSYMMHLVTHFEKFFSITTVYGLEFSLFPWPLSFCFQYPQFLKVQNRFACERTTYLLTYSRDHLQTLKHYTTCI